ncbi:hypothetical protein Bhyg_07878 [Pseudolycoriella hygida]|uniref:Uncharacterized protein n=1 Tax=Pseudolycoriella hygida TaxID=35572 RepID=A0A9Q0N3I5_9DIPT|nr:hypothetical protein Bhyg_07878 [Pseudolycoriella hygida]
MSAAFAVVSADVSHLQGGANGYNYPPNPQPSFQDTPSVEPQQIEYLPPQEEPVNQYIPPAPPAPQCPPGTYGQYPNCQSPPEPQCPAGTYGQYPNCQSPPASPPQQQYIPPSNPAPAADFNEQDGYNYRVPSRSF